MFYAVFFFCAFSIVPTIHIANEIARDPAQAVESLRFNVVCYFNVFAILNALDATQGLAVFLSPSLHICAQFRFIHFALEIHQYFFDCRLCHAILSFLVFVRALPAAVSQLPVSDKRDCRTWQGNTRYHPLFPYYYAGSYYSPGILCGRQGVTPPYPNCPHGADERT